MGWEYRRVHFMQDHILDSSAPNQRHPLRNRHEEGLTFHTLVLRRLNDLGREGWEVATGDEQEHMAVYLLKRQTGPQS